MTLMMSVHKMDYFPWKTESPPGGRTDGGPTFTYGSGYTDAAP